MEPKLTIVSMITINAKCLILICFWNKNNSKRTANITQPKITKSDVLVLYCVLITLSFRGSNWRYYTGPVFY